MNFKIKCIEHTASLRAIRILVGVSIVLWTTARHVNFSIPLHNCPANKKWEISQVQEEKNF